MKANKIIALVKDIKECWHTNNPYIIAKHLGIEVIFRDVNINGFTAQTVKFDNYPTVISINNAYSSFSKMLLCAHELGHALLHEDCINHFAVTSSNILTNVEYEANLFALALLSGDDVDSRLVMPLTDMSNYLLKSIMEHNIKFK